MDIKVIDALIRLFVLLTQINEKKISESARKIVEKYLSRKLNKELLTDYLAVFDNYIADYSIYTSITIEEKNKIIANHLKKICGKINFEFQQKEKNLLIIELFDFAKQNYFLSHADTKLISEIAIRLGLKENELTNIHNYILNEIIEIEPEKILMIDNREKPRYDKIKHIQHPTLEGTIIVLYITSSNTFIIKYIGNDKLFLNGHHIEIDKSYILAIGAQIKNPKTTPIYYGNISAKYIHAELDCKIYYIANNISYTYRNSKNGIVPFSFYETSGKLVGIMGSSGSGKSTLLNLLNGNLPIDKGEITINGFDLHKDRDKLKGIIGYVPQDDLLIEELTVYQNLYYTAKFCYKDYNEEQLKKTVNKAIIDFDLNETKKLRVGNPMNKILSGGQRKRLNIALELIREPSILFVDEPTSGLSSSDSDNIMNLLKRQTIKGRLVFAILHQPSSDIYKLIDRLVVIDKGGYIIYNSNPVAALGYFKKHGKYVGLPESECISCGSIDADIVLKTIEARIVNQYGRLTRIRKVRPREWSQFYKKEIENKKILKSIKKNKDIQDKKLPKSNFKVRNKFEQFKVYTSRNILSKIQNLQYLIINFSVPPILALLLANFSKFYAGVNVDPDVYIFSENKNLPQFLFMSIIVAIFVGLTSSAAEIIKDQRILKREKFINLSRFSYLCSKVAILFIISAIQTFCFVAIGYYILEIRDMLFAHWFLIFTTSCSANLIGLNISSGLKSIVAIYILIPFIIVPQLLFSGVIINFNDFNRRFITPEFVPLIGDIMPSRWSYEALAVDLFKNNEYEKQMFDWDKTVSNTFYDVTFSLPRLKNIINELETKIQKNNKNDTIAKKIELLKYEINKYNTVLPFNKLNDLSIDKINSNTIIEAKNHVEKLYTKFIDLHNNARKAKDDRYIELVEIYGENELVNMKKSYHNEALAALVKQKHQQTAFWESSNLIRKFEPIYQMPYTKHGRTHFYAPVKCISNYYLDTYWFNIFILWLMTGISFVTLYFDLLRKLLAGSEKLRMKILSKLN